MFRSNSIDYDYCLVSMHFFAYILGFPTCSYLYAKKKKKKKKKKKVSWTFNC